MMAPLHQSTNEFVIVDSVLENLSNFIQAAWLAIYIRQSIAVYTTKFGHDIYRWYFQNTLYIL